MALKLIYTSATDDTPSSGSPTLASSITSLALGVLSYHLQCEMKSPHLVDFS